jgi:hypothetical protein
MKKIILIAVLILTIVLAFFVLRPKNVTEKSCQKVHGIVTEIDEGGVKDATIKLSSNDTLFYINRAFENKFTLSELRNKLLNKEVIIYYIKNSSILSTNQNHSQQIRKMEVEKKMFYTEF